MSLSKKKYSFHRKKSGNKESNINKQQIIICENENIIKENNKDLLDQKLSVDNLICQTNSNEIINKESISPILFNNQNFENTKNKKEEENINNNKDLQYLINQNENENIDFINTLLKLKGISKESTNNFYSSKNINSYMKNFEDDNIFMPKSSKENNLTLNNQDKCSKKNPLDYSTLTSKINQINLNCNHHNNEKEENKNNLDIVTLLTNEINNDNINNKSNIGNSSNDNIKLIKNEQNTLLNELIIGNEKDKINYANSHTNKETVSSSDSNTNNTANINKKIENELFIPKEYYPSIKYIESLNNNNNNAKELDDKSEENNKKIKNRTIIPYKKEKINQTFCKNNINDKKYVNINCQKNIDDQINASSQKKIILNKKQAKRIPHNTKKKNHNNIISNMLNNNRNKNNSNEKKSKSKSKSGHMLINEQKTIKREFSNKNSNSKNNIKNKNYGNNKKKINTFKNNNITEIKTHYDNEENIISHNKSYNKTEIKYISNNFENDNNKIEKKLIFEFNDNNPKTKNKREEIKKRSTQIKEIDLMEIKESIKKNKINKSPKNNININYDNPFNSERKTTTIFKMSKIKSDISPNKNNNISYLNTRNESNKNNNKYKNIINLNSYTKIAQNKNFISPSLKNKNKRYLSNINKITDYENKDNSNHKHNYNSISINLNKNNIINNMNKNKQIIKKENNPKDLSKEKNQKETKILNKLEENKKNLIQENCEEEEINNNNINKLNLDELNNERIKEVKNIYNKNKRINKKSIFAEIFLFDNDEENIKEKSIIQKTDIELEQNENNNISNKIDLKNKDKDNNSDKSENTIVKSKSFNIVK